MGSARRYPREELGTLQTSVYPTVVSSEDISLHSFHLAVCSVNRCFYHDRASSIRPPSFRKTYTSPCPEERCLRLLDRDLHTWLGSLRYCTCGKIHLLPAIGVSN